MWKWKHQQKSVSWGHGKKKYPGKLDEQIYGEDVKKKKGNTQIEINPLKLWKKNRSKNRLIELVK